MRKAVFVSGAAVIAAATAAFLALHTRLHRSPEAPSCRPGPTTPGIDVSYYQRTIDWPAVRRAGIRFAFVRLSDGTTQLDPMFAANWSESRRAGVPRGAYQFFRPDQDAIAQADLMVNAMRGRDRAELPPVLDVEITAGLPAAVVAERAAAWIAHVRARLGVEPIVYTGVDMWRNGGGDRLAAQLLWVAHYTLGCPAVPAPWTRWTFWQHTDQGAVPGIEGPVDLNLFSGTVEQLPIAR